MGLGKLALAAAAYKVAAEELEAPEASASSSRRPLLPQPSGSTASYGATHSRFHSPEALRRQDSEGEVALDDETVENLLEEAGLYVGMPLFGYTHCAQPDTLGRELQGLCPPLRLCPSHMHNILGNTRTYPTIPAHPHAELAVPYARTPPRRIPLVALLRPRAALIPTLLPITPSHRLLDSPLSLNPRNPAQRPTRSRSAHPRAHSADRRNDLPYTRIRTRLGFCAGMCGCGRRCWCMSRVLAIGAV